MNWCQKAWRVLFWKHSLLFWSTATVLSLKRYTSIQPIHKTRSVLSLGNSNKFKLWCSDKAHLYLQDFLIKCGHWFTAVCWTGCCQQTQTKPHDEKIFCHCRSNLIKQNVCKTIPTPSHKMCFNLPRDGKKNRQVSHPLPKIGLPTG